jgi:hypothetical protein
MLQVYEFHFITSGRLRFRQKPPEFFENMKAKEVYAWFNSFGSHSDAHCKAMECPYWRVKRDEQKDRNAALGRQQTDPTPIVSPPFGAAGGQAYRDAYYFYKDREVFDQACFYTICSSW